MEKAVKYHRITPEQLKLYSSFVGKHPEIQTNKKDPTNPKRLEDLWKILSNKLNSLKGPTRTPKKWKESLTHRKNQLRSRARKNKADKIATEGGPSRTDELNSFEQRAMETLGNVVIDGLDTLPTRGLDKDEGMVLIDADPENISCSDLESFATSGETSMNSYLDSFPETSKSSFSKGFPKKIYKQVLDLIQRCEARDAEFQRQLLNQQTQIMEQQKLLIEVTKSVADALKHLVQRQE